MVSNDNATQILCGIVIFVNQVNLGLVITKTLIKMMQISLKESISSVKRR